MDLLENYRSEIDNIDKEMTLLFENRMNLSKKISDYKKNNNMQIYQSEREELVIAKNISYLKNKEYESFLRSYYMNLMNLSRLIQSKEINSDYDSEKVIKYPKENLKVGYQGGIGAFSEEAMHKHFSSIKNTKNYETFEELFIALKNEEIDYAIAPIENSSTGGISKVYDLLKIYDFYIVGEECIKINQHLIGVKGATINDIQEVYSHPQGFEQSAESLKRYENIKLIPYLNTAISAKLVSDLNDKTKAAIASERAAKIYNLDIIDSNINDNKDNYTKFVIIGRNFEVGNACDKSSIIFSTEHESGELYRLLKYFADYNINLTKIESRPNKHIPWQYLFYVDFEGSIKEEKIKRAIANIENESKYFKFLGSYKKGNI